MVSDDWRYSGNNLGDSTAIDTGGKLDLQNFEVDTAGHRMSGRTAETLGIPQSAGELITNMPESRKGV